jgi:hypothetical protein
MTTQKLQRYSYEILDKFWESIETSIISYASQLKYAYSKTPTLQLWDFR